MYKSTDTRNGHTLINAQEMYVIYTHAHTYGFPNDFVFLAAAMAAANEEKN